MTLTLTGRVRFREGYFGRMILQVEETDFVLDNEGRPAAKPVWRDASSSDCWTFTPFTLVLARGSPPEDH